jgi:hypothetical protein
MNRRDSRFVGLLIPGMILAAFVLLALTLVAQPPGQAAHAQASANGSLPIYTDAVATGWEGWSWGGVTRTFTNTAPVHSGAASSAVTYTEGWSGLKLSRFDGVDVSAYDTLRFWVHGGAAGGQLNHLNGALAPADVLGIFGREGLDVATLWDPPTAGEPGAFAFRIYRNYAGADQARLAVYAAQRGGDDALTLVVINKGVSPLTSTVTISGFTPAVSAQVYYVAPDGDDANAGTLTQPWRTIQHAADSLLPGDTAYIRAGVYHEHVVATRSGAAGALITLAAYPGETATVDGDGFDLWGWGGVIDLSGQSYVRVSGLRVVNSDYAGIFAEGGSHLTVEGCATYNTASSGIAFFAAADVLVEGNEVVLAGWGGQQEYITIAGVDGFAVRYNRVHGFNPVAPHRKEGIDAKDGAANGVIHHNAVYDLGKVGIYIDAFSKRTHNIRVYANFVHDIAGDDGIALAAEAGGALENIWIYNNLLAGNLVGLKISDCCPELAATHPMTDIYILNNTLAGNGDAEWGGGLHIANRDISNLVVRNNLISQNTHFQLLMTAGAPPGSLRADHNLIDGFRGVQGEIYGEDFVAGDPLLVDPAGRDLHLRAGSPAIDRGSAQDAPVADFDGSPRPLDGDGDAAPAFDIGAFEFALSGHKLYLPLTYTSHG